MRSPSLSVAAAAAALILVTAGCSGTAPAPAQSGASATASAATASGGASAPGDGTTTVGGAGGAADGATAGGTAATTDGAADPNTTKQLPQGGTTLFPTYRLVGYSGIAGTGPALGRAGVGDLDDRMTEMVKRAQPYAADGRTIMPTLELIATVVQGHPMKNGCWNTRADDAVIKKHLDAVRKVKGMLLLAIQPGRCSFPKEVAYYEKWLKEPDVGVALDPEWRMGPGQIPMRVFGSVAGRELDQTASYLANVVADNHLPQKVMLYHMIRTNWVKRPQDLAPHDGVAVIVSVDGIGGKSMKIDTWNAIKKVVPKHAQMGFKLFYEEDTKGAWSLMTPKQVMALKPTPSYVLYE